MKFNRFLTIAILAVITLLETGCSNIIHPTLARPNLGLESPAYAVACQQAVILQDDISQKQEDLHQFSFWTGTVAIGAGLATAGLGIYGASSDAVTGVALGVGTVVAARTYVPIPKRQEIYGVAQSGIIKALKGTYTIEPSPKPSTEGLAAVEVFSNQAGRVMTKFNAADKDVAGQSVAMGFLGSQVTSTADKVSRFFAEVKAFNVDTNRAALLIDSLNDIVLKANTGLYAETFDPQAALEAALLAITKAREKVQDAQKSAAEATKDLKTAAMVSSIVSKSGSETLGSIMIEVYPSLSRVSDVINSYKID